jgi:mitochondrial pyruvate carrier 2
MQFYSAQMCKWGLVLAGIKDLTRPAELLSVEQAAAIGATGYIYSRFSMVITPKNYTLLSVNVFVAITQTIQLFRALNYKHQQGELFAKSNAASK